MLTSLFSPLHQDMTTLQTYAESQETCFHNDLITIEYNRDHIHTLLRNVRAEVAFWMKNQFATIFKRFRKVF